MSRNSHLIFYSVFVFLCINTLVLKAQQIEYNIDFKGFADNREYFSEYNTPQTIFGELTSLEMGLQPDSFNSFFAGFSQLYEFGSKGEMLTPNLTAYYKGERNGYVFYIGAFPRQKLVKHPIVLLTDTFNYYRPNIEGAFLSVKHKYGNLSAWIDWLSRQSVKKNEMFMAGLSAYTTMGLFFTDIHVIMLHHAGTMQYNDNFQLRDNGGLTAMLGADLSQHTLLDSCTISSGVAFSYDRFRPAPLVYKSGSLSHIKLLYRWFGINAWIYSGQGQIQALGDMFYTAKNYSRIDTYIVPVNNKFVTCRFTLGWHIAPDQLDFSQQFMLVYKFGNTLTFKSPK